MYIPGILVKLSKENNTEKCLELLDKKKNELKVDVNERDLDLNSPLHYACFHRNSRLVSSLLYREAIIDCENKNKETPLIITSQKGYDDIF